MKTTVERVDDTTVKLSVTVEAQRVRSAIESAARKLAAEVTVPGFRPGRVPRRVLETRLGSGAVLQEAARDALPEFYAEAAESEDLDVVAQPTFDVETFEDGKDAAFTVTVEVRPDVTVPDYRGLRIPHPDWQVSDDDVAEQLTALRERFAELETVQRPVQAGDHAVITMSGQRNGQPVEDVAVEDYLYEVPARATSNDDQKALDRNLLGAQPGSILKFTDTLGVDYGEQLAGTEVDFTVIVKEVKAKRLPDLDDDFAITASEFDTIDELRAELRQQLGVSKRAYARAALRGRVVEAVTDLVDVALPASLVSNESNFRLTRLAQQAQRQGMDFERFLADGGDEAQTVLGENQEEARKTVKAQLVVDAIGQQAGIQIGQEDLVAEIARQAARMGQPHDEVARFLTHPDRLPAVASDAFRRKVIDHLVASVIVVGGPPDDEDAEGGDEAAS